MVEKGDNVVGGFCGGGGGLCVVLMVLIMVFIIVLKCVCVGHRMGFGSSGVTCRVDEAVKPGIGPRGMGCGSMCTVGRLGVNFPKGCSALRSVGLYGGLEVLAVGNKNSG